MKKLASLLLGATLFSPNTFAGADPVLATYKGGEVKESQVLEQFKAAFEAQPLLKGKKFSELDPKLQETLVRGYINSKLLDQEVKNKNIAADKALQEKLAAITKQIEQQELIENYVKEAVTDKVIAEEYVKLEKSLDGKQEVKASHILVDSEEKAKAAKKKLSKGTKFAEVVKEYSLDEGTKGRGGSLGYFRSGQLVPEFEAKAFSMKNGEISDPVKTQFGWHIILVEDKRPIKLKEEDKTALVNKLKHEAIEKLLNDLSSKADVKLSLPAAPAAKSGDETKK
ncbi:MAG: peptidylprolyl isomerase [Pseudomonadota bacterium]